MSYRVIARKWRPQNFAQLIGQNHISQTLTNALRNDRLPHALLFTGPRGTGKTSSARILAKALRCPNAKDFIPCENCVECREISISRSPNVIEIDGASNNGVDAIRELRDSVVYAPSSGRFKIYIVDEVHMLSTSAFNALLKTLEEPPAHVIFILATTEVQKIPATILSRCQRFDFRRISTRQIADHLQSICQAEKISADADALWLIARQGDGSMRDSQSLLDQVVSFANGQLSLARVSEILGLTDRQLLLEALTAWVQRDTKVTLQVLGKLMESGTEPTLFAAELLEQLRNTLFVKLSESSSAGEKQTPLVELPESEWRALQSLAQQLSEEDLHLLFDMAMKLVSDLHRSTDPRLVLEMGLLRIANAPRVTALAQILSAQPQVPAANVASGPAKSPAPTVAVASKVTAAVRSTGPKPAAERWFDFVQNLKTSEPLLAAKIDALLFVNEVGRILHLSIPAKDAFLKGTMDDKATREKLQSALEQVWGAGVQLQITVATGTAAPGVAVPDSGVSAKALQQEREHMKKQSLNEEIAAHPKVRAASSVFKGQIKTIKETP